MDEEQSIPFKKTLINGTLFSSSNNTLIIISTGWLVTRKNRDVQQAFNILKKLGPSLFIYDSLIYTQSNLFKSFIPLCEDELAQLLAVIDYFKQKYIFKNIILEGISLGALFSTIATIQEKDISGLIAINGFFNYLNFLHRHPVMDKITFSPLYKKITLKDVRFIDELFHPERIKVPTLVMHGLADKYLSPETSVRFFNRLLIKDKQLELLKGVDHFFYGTGVEIAREKISIWLKVHSF